jgi:hypothetical protein
MSRSFPFERITIVHSKGGFKELFEIAQRPWISQTVQPITYDFERFGVKMTPGDVVGIQSYESTIETFAQRYTCCHGRELLEENSIEIPSLAAALLHFRRLRSIWLVRDMDRSGHDWPTPHRPVLDCDHSRQITGALAIAGLEIEELKIGSRDYGPSLLSALGPDPSKQELYRQAFRALKRLAILWRYYCPGLAE